MKTGRENASYIHTDKKIILMDRQCTMAYQLGLSVCIFVHLGCYLVNGIIQVPFVPPLVVLHVGVGVPNMHVVHLPSTLISSTIAQTSEMIVGRNPLSTLSCEIYCLLLLSSVLFA